jgi:2-polyprenyl-6-methoxyphenol hydroxylase-like FAD-dependent oxidoreductase
LDERWDVVIVGGRPAGASLAARLGALGRRVLVLDRSTFPSGPTVPSCPTVHMGTMKLLDELGVEEAAYAAGAVRFRRFVVQFTTHFTAELPFPTVHGRAHGWSIERHHFDRVLWEHLARYPTVERREGFVVEDVVRDDHGRVSGVSGRTKGGSAETFRARFVVGADGRFSAMAGKLGAGVVEESAEKVSTVYFADWEGVEPFRRGEDVVQVCTTGRGLNVLFFPLPNGRLTACVHERADRVDPNGDAEGFYRGRLASLGPVADRMGSARMVSRMVGMKRVGNGFRKASGPGWALAGDAFHYKDPVDGQGIYDALLGTKILAEELGRAFEDGQDDAALARYAERAVAATRPMYLATCKRLADELYSEPPAFVIRTLIRWMLTEPEYQERFIRFLGRDIPPESWLTSGVMARAVFRGLRRDVLGR